MSVRKSILGLGLAAVVVVLFSTPAPTTASPAVKPTDVAALKASSASPGQVYHVTKRRAKRRYYGRSANYSSRQTYRRASSRGVGPRPLKWCGWWMRTQKGGGPEFNVAWNWRHYGRPVSGPQVGAVVVWRHHVGMITGRAANGKWIVKSGNDGGKVRERARSVKGAVFRM